MHGETGATSPNNANVALPSVLKRRVRTDAGRLTREAARRRNRANTAVVASLVVVLALVRIFYALLTR